MDERAHHGHRREREVRRECLWSNPHGGDPAQESGNHQMASPEIHHHQLDEGKPDPR